jgi:hypothetical protein
MELTNINSSNNKAILSRYAFTSFWIEAGEIGELMSCTPASHCNFKPDRQKSNMAQTKPEN